MEDHPDIRIIAVPYDSGHRGLRMGAGPKHLLDNGLGEVLRSDGRGLSVTTVRHERARGRGGDLLQAARPGLWPGASGPC